MDKGTPLVRPMVGICLCVRNGSMVLLHKRKGEHAKGMWAFPGGHLEMWEDFEACALRELLEEAGPDIKVSQPKFFTALNTTYPLENKHYVTIVMVCNLLGGEAKVMEPEKCESWLWCDWNNLPNPLMKGLVKMVHEDLNPIKFGVYK